MASELGPEVDVDVVIVGGRPAGASLAARLGAAGHRVALLDRARFPSPPSVPSAPLLYSAALAQLDDLGLAEAEYAAAAAPLRSFGFVFRGHFEAVLQVPRMHGRDYAVGLDRERFDEVLWRFAGRQPSVERREGFAVSELLRDGDGRVIGVIGAERGGPEQRLRARAVVGADGRFSLVARKAGAPVIEEETEHLSTVYYSVWEGVAPFRAGVEGPQVHVTGRGLDVLFVPLPGGRTLVNTHERADRVRIDGDPQRYFLASIAKLPSAAERLADARQVGELIGIKRIGNGYREAAGPGWALVGDALHYKDPADGQGIYDALLGAKLLANQLDRFLRGAAGWDAAMADYRREFHDATHPMYVETVSRLRRELYDEPPEFIIKTLIRWSMTDPAYQAQFLRYLGREISPTGWNSPKLLAGAALRGLWRDLSGTRAA